MEPDTNGRQFRGIAAYFVVRDLMESVEYYRINASKGFQGPFPGVSGLRSE